MTAQRFQGKVAVVTGGNSGIGLGVAKAYAREGARVAITGTEREDVEAAAKEIGDGTVAIQADSGRVAEIAAAMKKSMLSSLTRASRSSSLSIRSPKSYLMRRLISI